MIAAIRRWSERRRLRRTPAYKRAFAREFVAGWDAVRREDRYRVRGEMVPKKRVDEIERRADLVALDAARMWLAEREKR